MSDQITIRSNRLEAKVVKPGSPLYGGTRFNWNCFVDSILLDGEYQFAEPEQRFPDRVTSRGKGLCSEYQQRYVHDETPVGEKWPRMGCGYIIREEKPYQFMRFYPVEPFQTTWDASENAVRFTTEAALCQGYAYREEKTVSVSGNQIIIETTLYNQGEKQIVAQEYNHNFLSLNGAPVNEKYRLLLPQFNNVEHIMEGGQLVGREGYLTWSGAPKAGEPFFNFLNDVKPDLQPVIWKLVHDELPISVSESDDFVPVRGVVWGVEHCICTEVFVNIDLAPGQSQHWVRKWTFENTRK